MGSSGEVKSEHLARLCPNLLIYVSHLKKEGLVEDGKTEDSFCPGPIAPSRSQTEGRKRVQRLLNDHHFTANYLNADG
jgi:hypothetical protein